MNGFLSKLQKLLDDILVNAKAIRHRKGPITLLDVKVRFSEIWNERDLFLAIDEFNKENASDFLMESSIFYFFMRAIQIKDSEFLKSESNQLKGLIFKAIGCIHFNVLMDESLTHVTEYLNNKTSVGNKPGIEAFYQLLEAKMPGEEYFDYALFFYTNLYSEQLTNWKETFKLFKPLTSFVGNAQDSKKFSILVNEIIVMYFYMFCDLETIDKKFMHTELNLIERRISNHRLREKILLCWSIKDIYDMVCMDSLVRGEKKQYLLEELMAKVFYNDYSISYSLQSNRDDAEFANYIFKNCAYEGGRLENDVIQFHRDDYYTTPGQLLSNVFSAYKEEFDQNPGVVVCLYLLSMEIESDPYFAFFSLEKENEKKYELAAHYLKKMDVTLEIENMINRKLEISGEQGKNYRRFHNIFSGYKDAIKKGKTEEYFKLQQEKQELGVNQNFDLKRDLLQRFLWLTIVFKCGLYYDNNEDVYKINSDRDKMLIPFCNGMMDNEYANIEYVNTNFNSILKKIGVENGIDLSIDKIKDYKSIVLLVYNLSRAEFNSKEFLINEINFIRELQKKKLRIDIRTIPTDEKEQARASMRAVVASAVEDCTQSDIDEVKMIEDKQTNEQEQEGQGNPGEGVL